MRGWQHSRRASQVLLLIAMLQACGGEPVETTDTAERNEQPAILPGTGEHFTPPAKKEQQVETATYTVLEGTVSYDRVPFDKRLYKGLDYTGTKALPVRGVTVQLLDTGDTVVAETATDLSGHYSFSLVQESVVKVRVLAELLGRSSAGWDVSVRDNTNGNALYVVEGALASVGNEARQTRDLHAASGWDGSSYSNPRSAAPFAVLDSIFDAISIVVEADPTVVMPPLAVYWSERNIAAGGSLQDGRIGTSFYTSAGPSIYLLGAANNDADEYDRAVVQHEFAHYLEHQLGRSENIGGSHNINSKLDMRVAFSEAWGNAFAGMSANDPVYRDSMGQDQAQGFAIDVGRKSFGKQGWFSEGTIQHIFWDLFDAGASGDDPVHLGFEPIYKALLGESYAEFDGLASIYPFIDQIKQSHPEQATALTERLHALHIFGVGSFGEGESNNAGYDSLLPVYQTLTAGASTEVCSNNGSQEYNGVDVRRFIKIDIAGSGNYVFRAAKSRANFTHTNPELRLLRRGREIASARKTTRDYEQLSLQLNAGTYILEVFEASNVDRNNNSGGFACFNVRLD